MWGLANVEDADNVEVGIDIDSFIERIQRYNLTCYFHNLKFDGWFILNYLLKNGFEYYNDKYAQPRNTFKALISDMGKFFSITVRWGNGHTVEFRDSLKKLPMSVKRIAQSFGLDEGKGEIDYHTHRLVGHQPTPEEFDYLRRDVSIVAKAMKTVIDNGMTKLTVASDSLAEYKSLVGDKYFSRCFPVLSEHMDAEIRRAYKGGFTYADDRFKGCLVGEGLVLDVNSLYPSVMMNNILPYGEPEFVPGKCEPTTDRPLTVFSVTFTAKLRPEHIPCIQIKGHSIFGGTEYLTEISDPVTLMVTNVDWSLYNDHYDIDVLAYGGGWRFHATRGMFDAYINKWSKIKAESTGGLRELAKLHLNGLYGKFGTNPNVTSKIPVLDDDGSVKLIRGEDEIRPPIYTAVAVFVTAFARDLTIRAAQENYPVFAYADTDSLHLLTLTIPTTIDVHPTKLGAWKHEYNFSAAFYVRAKAYIERHHANCPCKECKEKPEQFTTHIAGLPEHLASKLTFDDMHTHVIEGKLEPKSVPGGVILRNKPYKLQV